MAATSSQLDGPYRELMAALAPISNPTAPAGELPEGKTRYDIATESAKNLVNTCQAVRNSLYALELDTQRMNFERLKQEVTPYDIAETVIEQVCHSKVQSIHALKKELSVASRFLIELIAFQSLLKKDERFQSESIEAILDNIKKSLPIIPEKEVETRFELKCCLEAAKKIDIDQGKKDKIIDDHKKSAIMALIKTLATAKPTPPHVSPQYIIDEVVHLSTDLYNLLEESWHQKLWLLRWHSADEKIQNSDDYQNIREHFDYKSHHLLAFYIGQLFIKIIGNPAVDRELKKELIHGKDLSLAILAQYTPRKVHLESSKLPIPFPTWGDTYWETRFLTMQYLYDVAQQHLSSITINSTTDSASSSSSSSSSSPTIGASSISGGSNPLSSGLITIAEITQIAFERALNDKTIIKKLSTSLIGLLAQVDEEAVDQAIIAQKHIFGPDGQLVPLEGGYEVLTPEEEAEAEDQYDKQHPGKSEEIAEADTIVAHGSPPANHSTETTFNMVKFKEDLASAKAKRSLEIEKIKSEIIERKKTIYSLINQAKTTHSWKALALEKDLSKSL